MDSKQERQAVFWCSLLRPVLYGEIGPGEVAAYLRRLCGEEVVFPDGQRRRPSLSTLKRKLRAYRAGGFDSLKRKGRSDRGAVRVVPKEVIATAVAAKCDQPLRSHGAINLILQERHGKALSRSTLYRHLKSADATRRKLGVSRKAVRKRWTCEAPHDMWIGDFSHGPPVLMDGLGLQTRLSAFIDVHSRYIVAGRYYLKESFDILCDTLIRGFAVHGAPRALYLDNAKVYHALALKSACYRLHINLLHRPPRDPAPGGLVERFFATVQGQFESEVRAREALSLQDLNQAFGAWLDVAYHMTVHGETKQTPRERLQAGLVHIREVDMEAVAESFLQCETRTVDKTFSDVRLDNRFYRVDKKLRGDRVEVRYDPFGDGQEVFIYSREGLYRGKGLRHEREQGEPAPAHTVSPAQMDVLGTLVQRQQQLFAEETVDFSQAARARIWPFGAFAAAFADLLGRKGGITGFSETELDALRSAHSRMPQLTRTLLKKAFAMSTKDTIPAIIMALQTIHKEK